MSPGCRSPGSASAARRAGPRPTEPRAGSRITRRWLPLGPIPVNVCGLEWGLGGLVSREREAAVTGVFAPWELGKAANRAPPHLPPESQKPPPVAAPLGEAPDSRAQLLAEAGAPRGVPPGSLPASAVVHAAFTTTHVTEESVSRGMRRGAEETPGAWEGPGAGGVGGSRGDTPEGSASSRGWRVCRRSGFHVAPSSVPRGCADTLLPERPPVPRVSSRP